LFNTKPPDVNTILLLEIILSVVFIHVMYNIRKHTCWSSH